MRLCEASHNRKNWLFTGSPDGGASAAIAYTLIQTAKINGLNPATYLADTVRRLLGKAAPESLTPARVAPRPAADEQHSASR